MLKGKAVASKQAAIEVNAASKMGINGIETSCKVSVVAASMNMLQIYPKIPPTADAIKP